VVAMGGDPQPTPALLGGTEESLIGTVIYQGLVYVDKDHHVRPSLAESWDISADQKVYTFKLRKNVKWQDGQDFTSADVEFDFKSILPKYAPRSGPTFTDIVQSVEAPDPLTVKVTLKRPYGPFLSQVDGSNSPILPQHLYAGTDIANNPHNRMPIGTGPFTLSEWVAGDHITLKRNDNYWVAGQPYLDSLIYKIIPQATSRAAAIQAGEVDYLPYAEIQPQDFANMKDNPKLQWATGEAPQAQVDLTLNVQHDPLSNKAFRQALYTAIDRNVIQQQLYLGLDNVANNHLHGSIGWAISPDVDLSKMYAFDTNKANQMLDQAGFARGADGNRIKQPLSLVVEAARPNFAPLAQIIQQQWKAIGVPTTIQQLERQVMIQKVYMQRDFDVNVNELTSAGDPELGSARLYICSSIKPVSFTNGAGYCNQDLDKLFQQGSMDSDDSKRAQSYFQAEKILAADLPSLPIIDRVDHSVASTKFEFKSTMWAEGVQTYDGFSTVYQK
jgi:peptide/nickel transport system substrate-binding protein